MRGDLFCNVGLDEAQQVFSMPLFLPSCFLSPTITDKCPFLARFTLIFDWFCIYGLPDQVGLNLLLVQTRANKEYKFTKLVAKGL